MKLRHTDPRRPVRLAAADALQLPFGDRAFACVTSAFLLRNLADLERGRIEERQGHADLALSYYREFLRVYDRAVSAHRQLTEEAKAAVVRLAGKGN